MTRTTSDLDPLYLLVTEATALWIRNPTDQRVLGALLNAQVEISKMLVSPTDPEPMPPATGPSQRYWP
jgi:hypothetical protein